MCNRIAILSGRRAVGTWDNRKTDRKLDSRQAGDGAPGRGFATSFTAYSDVAMSTPNKILLDPYSRTIDMLFSEHDKARLESLGQVLWFDGSPAPDAYIDEHLPAAIALIGQAPMPRKRLDQAPNLRAIFNVSGGFDPRVDHEECHRRHIHVLSCSRAFAPAVAEMALGMALAAARGITTGDANVRQGKETYSFQSNEGCFLLRGKTFGLIGCGNVGSVLTRLLRVFDGDVLVHDPWIHDQVLAQQGCQPVGLDELFSRSRIVFIVSAPTWENEHGLGARHFAMMKRGSVVVLVGRADVVDFDALLDAADSGHISAAIDVYPHEPVPPDHRVRTTANTVLSSHRCGGLPEAYRDIGRMVVDDLELILRDLPPQRMQSAGIEILRRLGKIGRAPVPARQGT